MLIICQISFLAIRKENSYEIKESGMFKRVLQYQRQFLHANHLKQSRVYKEDRFRTLPSGTLTRTDHISFTNLLKNVQQCHGKRSPPFRHSLSSKLTHSILLSPASRSRLVLVPVSLVHMGNLRYQRIIRIRVRQQGTY